MISINKHILSNGLTVLVCPRYTVPKVTVQLWYNVGSKDEKIGEKGIAHLIEHMLFKGTTALSETDIIEITNKFSGYCNAWTSYDFTTYHFDFPKNDWIIALDILSDTMRNCTFKEEFLASEMKAVIQELKLYKDDYESTLQENLISAIFASHPYHYPIIGTKHDLFTVSRDSLLNFYHQHYVPNNATLIVVGDVSPQEVLMKVQEYFGIIRPDFSYKKESFTYTRDVATTSITLARSIEQPMACLAFVIPGMDSGKTHLFELLSWIMGKGRGSRLYKKLVLETEFVSDIEISLANLFEQDLLFVNYQPFDQQDNEKIIQIIHQEFLSLVKEGISDLEMTRAIKNLQAEFSVTTQTYESLATEIGELYLATGKENCLNVYATLDSTVTSADIIDCVQTYIKPIFTHTGFVNPINKNDIALWNKFQQESDAQDDYILSQRQRLLPLEQGKKINGLKINIPSRFEFPKPSKIMLENGLAVLWHNNAENEKIDIHLEFKAKSFFDPEDIEGISNFVSEMLLEGTSKFDAIQLAEQFESRGISLETQPGHLTMSMLSKDFEIGLSLLGEILQNSIFGAENIERVREQILSDIKDYWDEPTEFVEQLAREALYKDHPFRKNPLGTAATIKKITRDQLLSYFKNYISPHGAALAIVGNFLNYDVAHVVTQFLGSWNGPLVPDIMYPLIVQPEMREIDYRINRDQVLLAFVSLSVARLSDDYEPLALFDHYFTGGIQGSMSSYLFKLREQTGLFYTIGGSVILGSSHQPGIVFAQTVVSLSNLKQAEKLIRDAFDTALDSMTEADLQIAKNGIINTMIDHFETNKQTCGALLFLHDYQLGSSYFEKRCINVQKITLADLRSAAGKYIDSSKLITIKIGRV